jgi:hypothetical protein
MVPMLVWLILDDILLRSLVTISTSREAERWQLLAMLLMGRTSMVRH